MGKRPGDGVTVCSLADAIESGNGAVSAHLGNYADVEEDGFIALNTAFIGDGALIEIAEDVTVESQLHLVFVSSDQEQTVSHPRVLVVAGRGSSATIVESYVGVPGNRCLTNSVAEIVLEDEATLEQLQASDGERGCLSCGRGASEAGREQRLQLEGVRAAGGAWQVRPVHES